MPAPRAACKQAEVSAACSFFLYALLNQGKEGEFVTGCKQVCKEKGTATLVPGVA